MIPKPLSEITWADLEALRDSGRQEDDRIEFKGSFSGGSDYEALTESQREKANKSIAREVIAFLNGRGGDVVIGAEEASGDCPCIAALKPFANANAIAVRLEQSLSQIIEPYQSIVGVRAVTNGDSGDGIIVVRAPQSLRAPHRLTKDNVCYIRRGRASVPMPMDEIQDLTVGRRNILEDRMRELESHFGDFGSDYVGRAQMPGQRFHIRAVFIPLVAEQNNIIDADCAAMARPPSGLFSGRKEVPCRTAQLFFGQTWKPILRGKSIQKIENYNTNIHRHFEFMEMRIFENGIMGCDCALEMELGQNLYGIREDFIFQYLYHFLFSFTSARLKFSDGVMRIKFFTTDDIKCEVTLNSGQSSWHNWRPGVITLPDFPITEDSNFLTHFERVQTDMAATLGREPNMIYSCQPVP